MGIELSVIFATFGILGLAAVIVAETGFLPLFFLPGDTLLFSAGYFIHRGDLPIHHAVLALGLAAFLGNILGYYMGAYSKSKIDNYIENNKKSLSKGFNKTKKFYEKYGILTLFIARFVPMVRTIAPFLAGVTKINKTKFLIASFLSGLVWVSVGLFLGNYFGKKVPNMDNIMSMIMIIAVSLAIFPVLFTFIKKKKNEK